MLVLVLPVGEAGEVLLHDEPARSAGGVREDRVDVGEAAVADPLLAAGQAVAGELSVFLDRHRDRAQGGEVAAGLGLGGPVGHDGPLGDLAEPELLLLRRAEAERVAAEQRGQDPGRYADVEPRQSLTRAVDVVGTAPHASELFGQEHELDPQLGAAHLTDGALGAFVPGVEVEQNGGSEPALRVLPKGLEDHLQILAGEALGGASEGHTASPHGVRGSVRVSPDVGRTGSVRVSPDSGEQCLACCNNEARCARVCDVRGGVIARAHAGASGVADRPSRGWSHS